MPYLVKIPWCNPNLIVPDSWDKDTVELLVKHSTGSSGVTFNWHGFVRALRKEFKGDWSFINKEKVSNLPCGIVHDCLIVVDSRFEPIN